MVRVRTLIALAVPAVLLLFFWEAILTALIAVGTVLLMAFVLLLILSFMPGIGWIARSVLFWSFRIVTSLVRGFVFLALGRRGRSGIREHPSVLPLKPAGGISMGRGRLPLRRPRAGLVELTRGGLLIVGRYEPVTRAVIASLLESGRRVVVIGRVALLPETVREEEVRIIWLKKVRPNLLELPNDRVERRRAVEEISVAVSVAEGLDAVETGMVSRFIDLVMRSGAAPSEEDLERLRTEYSTLAGRLKDPVAVLLDFFGPPNLPLGELLEGGWRVAVLDPSHLSDSLATFSVVYLAQAIGKVVGDAVVIVEGAERVLTDISVLPYDARTVWLRLYGALERLALHNSLVLLTSNPNFSPQLLDLVRTFVLVEAPVTVLSFLKSRLGLDVRNLPHVAALTRTDSSWEVRPLDVPELKPIPVRVARSAMRILQESVRGRISAVMRDTVLFADFADLAHDAYRALRAVRMLKDPTEESVEREASVPRRLIAELIEKGYVSRIGPRLVLTQLGESAMSDFESKVGGRLPGVMAPHAGKSSEEVEERADAEQPSQGLQTGLELFSGQGPQISPSDLGDVWRMLSDARAAHMRGDYGKSIRIAYKGLYELLKRITGAQKGRIPELASLASAKGVKISEQDAKRAVAAIAHATKSQDQKQLEEDSLFITSLLESVLLGLESLGLGTGEDDVGNLDDELPDLSPDDTEEGGDGG